jgi:hypothetical protein
MGLERSWRAYVLCGQVVESVCETAKREMIRSKSPVQGLTGEGRDQIKMAKNVQPIWKASNSNYIM